MVVGDFIITKYDDENLGCVHVSFASKLDFTHFIDNYALMDMPFVGSKFTWYSNKEERRIWERSDKALVSSNWLSEFPSFSLKHLERTCSNHSLILVQNILEEELVILHLNSNGCGYLTQISSVRSSWEVGCKWKGLHKLTFKIKRLKFALRSRNAQLFGKTFKKLDVLRDQIEEWNTFLKIIIPTQLSQI